MRTHECPTGECYRPCPEHSVTHCPTCHKHPGECSYGDCEEQAVGAAIAPKWEHRTFCLHHLTHPMYQFARC